MDAIASHCLGRPSVEKRNYGFAPGRHRDSSHPFFNLVHFWNTGAAFSFLADAGGWQRYFFIVIALVVSIVLALILRKRRAKSEALGYSLILGGAVGNLIDRAFRGHVIDYLDFYWQSWHWPAFNLADIGIVGGAAMLILSSLLSPNAEAGRVNE